MHRIAYSMNIFFFDIYLAYPKLWHLTTDTQKPILICITLSSNVLKSSGKSFDSYFARIFQMNLIGSKFKWCVCLHSFRLTQIWHMNHLSVSDLQRSLVGNEEDECESIDFGHIRLMRRCVECF